MSASENTQTIRTTLNSRDEWMVQQYMAKGFDRETAESLTLINNNGQRVIG